MLAPKIRLFSISRRLVNRDTHGSRAGISLQTKPVRRHPITKGRG